MDHDFYSKQIGVADPAVLDRILDKFREVPVGAIPRFSYRVEGIVFGQYPEIDTLVDTIKDYVKDLPELQGTTVARYYAIHWVRAGTSLKEHTDISNGKSFDDLWIHKVHVPLVTAPEVLMGFRRNLRDPVTWHHLEQGKVYHYNNVVFHQVVNNSTEVDRAHLILYFRDPIMEAHFKDSGLWGPKK